MNINNYKKYLKNHRGFMGFDLLDNKISAIKSYDLTNTGEKSQLLYPEVKDVRSELHYINNSEEIFSHKWELLPNLSSYPDKTYCDMALSISKILQDNLKTKQNPFRMIGISTDIQNNIQYKLYYEFGIYSDSNSQYCTFDNKQAITSLLKMCDSNKTSDTVYEMLREVKRVADTFSYCTLMGLGINYSVLENKKSCETKIYIWTDGAYHSDLIKYLSAKEKISKKTIEFMKDLSYKLVGFCLSNTTNKLRLYFKNENSFK